jgi:hypothetical protein
MRENSPNLVTLNGNKSAPLRGKTQIFPGVNAKIAFWRFLPKSGKK